MLYNRVKQTCLFLVFFLFHKSNCILFTSHTYIHTHFFSSHLCLFASLRSPRLAYRALGAPGALRLCTGELNDFTPRQLPACWRRKRARLRRETVNKNAVCRANVIPEKQLILPLRGPCDVQRRITVAPDM